MTAWVLLIGEAVLCGLVGVLFVIGGLATEHRSSSQFDFAPTREQLLSIGTLACLALMVLVVLALVTYLHPLTGGTLLVLFGVAVLAIGLVNLGPARVLDSGAWPVLSILVAVPGVLFMADSLPP